MKWSVGGLPLTGNGRRIYSYQHLSQYHFAVHKSYMKWPDVESGYDSVPEAETATLSYSGINKNNYVIFYGPNMLLTSV